MTKINTLHWCSKLEPEQYAKVTAFILGFLENTANRAKTEQKEYKEYAEVLLQYVEEYIQEELGIITDQQVIN